MNRILWPMAKWTAILIVTAWAACLLYGLVTQPKYLLGFIGIGGWLVALIIHLSADSAKTRDVAAFFVFGALYVLLFGPLIYLLFRL